jgi:hypothetical protein
MRSFALGLCAVVAGSLFVSASGQAATLAVGAPWDQQVQLMASGDYFNTEYTAAAAEYVRVTGFYVTGDYYNVYVNGNLVLTTPQIQPIDVDLGDTDARFQDPGYSFSSGRFSTGTFRVSANDVIAIQDLYVPQGNPRIGEVAVDAVPEPASLAFCFAGLAVAVVSGRYRRR